MMKIRPFTLELIGTIEPITGDKCCSVTDRINIKHVKDEIVLFGPTLRLVELWVVGTRIVASACSTASQASCMIHATAMTALLVDGRDPDTIRSIILWIF